MLDLLIAGAWGIATSGVFAWVFIGHQLASRRTQRRSLPRRQWPTDEERQFYAREDIDPAVRTRDAVAKGYAPIAIIRPAIAPPPRRPMSLKSEGELYGAVREDRRLEPHAYAAPMLPPPRPRPPMNHVLGSISRERREVLPSRIEV